MPLLREVLDDYLRSLDADAAKGTGPEYLRMAQRTWLPSLGPLPVDAITRQAVSEWVAAQRRTETERSVKARAKAKREGRPVPEVQFYRPKSIKNAHGLLSAVLAYAVDPLGVIAANPARGVRMPSDSEDADREIFTREEFARFWQHMDPHYRPLLLFLVATGTRISEATAIQVRDFDLNPAMPSVRVRRAWKTGENYAGRYLGSPKSRRGRRTIVLDAAQVEVFAPLMRGKDASEFVFTTPAGGSIHPGQFRERQWRRALTGAGITKDLTPHSLRHTNASWSLMGGIPAQVVQHRLGHESLNTTSQVYAHLLVDAQVGAAALMAAHVPGTQDAPQIEG
ncbi:tyrosine-type recombinase/integrase [Sanguibacter sp. Z1732]|uniref:tyrosine-type recombinase/integrase n=1 Tax=Sanguibacter sp. Z1732 TaxID=3435412 RepID=UPI003D9CBB07